MQTLIRQPFWLRAAPIMPFCLLSTFRMLCVANMRRVRQCLSMNRSYPILTDSCGLLLAALVCSVLRPAFHPLTAAVVTLALLLAHPRRCDLIHLHNLLLSLHISRPLNIQPIVVVTGLKRQQAAALTNFVGCFLLALSYSFFLSFFCLR